MCDSPQARGQAGCGPAGHRRLLRCARARRRSLGRSSPRGPGRMPPRLVPVCWAALTRQRVMLVLMHQAAVISCSVQATVLRAPCA